MSSRRPWNRSFDLRLLSCVLLPMLPIVFYNRFDRPQKRFSRHVEPYHQRRDVIHHGRQSLPPLSRRVRQERRRSLRVPRVTSASRCVPLSRTCASEGNAGGHGVEKLYSTRCTANGGARREANACKAYFGNMPCLGWHRLGR